MRSGLALYAASLQRLASFYARVFLLDHVDQDDGYVMLQRGNFELAILETAASRERGRLTGPPALRESTPIKPILFMDETLNSISARIIKLGGGMHQPKPWTLNERLVCDGWDCEGNIFQLRLLPGK